ncbi:hypothetical protein [Paralimibaculum aggregatum]|uniref:hypothetical protein n=1 Tax=Paralimibaculum aggregatum TaxID=3036245 RepID=UPI002552D5AE|nr:hypothetical protein [Limibaculum sp. NKW23]
MPAASSRPISAHRSAEPPARRVAERIGGRSRPSRHSSQPIELTPEEIEVVVYCARGIEPDGLRKATARRPPGAACTAAPVTAEVAAPGIPPTTMATGTDVTADAAVSDIAPSNTPAAAPATADVTEDAAAPTTTAITASDIAPDTAPSAAPGTADVTAPIVVPAPVAVPGTADVSAPDIVPTAALDTAYPTGARVTDLPPLTSPRPAARTRRGR